MTVFGCILCFITGALTVLAAQSALPRTLRIDKRRTVRTDSTAAVQQRRETTNFLSYDGSEQPAGESL